MATVTQIDDRTYASADGRYRTWLGLPGQVFIRDPLPGYEYGRTMGGETILRPQYDRQRPCYQTAEGEAYMGEVTEFLQSVWDAHNAREEAAEEAAEAGSREWRSPRGLALTEEMDREDSDY